MSKILFVDVLTQIYKQNNLASSSLHNDIINK